MRPRMLEDLLAAKLGATATPLPPEVGDVLPRITLQQTGGYRANEAAYTHRVGIDVWASTWAEAYASANAAVEAVEAVRDLDGAPVYTSECDGLPYPNPDPRRDQLARYSFTAVLTVRGATS